MPRPILFSDPRTVEPKIIVKNAQTTLLFLVSSGLAYENSTDDPWFSAHRFATGNKTLGFATYYLADEPATVLGCTSSRLFCNPAFADGTDCLSTLGDWTNEQLLANFTRIWPDANDQASLLPLSLILHQFDAQDIGALYKARGVSNLLARNTITEGKQRKPLPVNQWHLEMEYVSQAMLAAMQHYMIDYARGFWAQSILCDFMPCRRLCRSQVC